MKFSLRNLPGRVAPALLFISFVCAARADWPAAFSAPGDVIHTSNGFTAPAEDLVVTLGFAPEVGTSLTVVDNTGLSLIDGVFPNVSHGDVVAVDYGGLTYSFLANYHGGNGNDLVLEWAPRKVIGWGYNDYSQVAGRVSRYLLSPVDMPSSEAVEGKWVSGCDTSRYHSLMVAFDGSAAAIGEGSSFPQGVLGAGSILQSDVPVAVESGKDLVAVDAGWNHSIGLCADGTVLCWGYDIDHQNGSGSSTTVPVEPNVNGTLSGKEVVAITAGAYHNVVICADGTLVGWGKNDFGQLGIGFTSANSDPAVLDQTGVLAGKTVVRIAAGWYHCLALCSDGTVASWGRNYDGQLGNGLTVDSPSPVLVDTSGALSGKTVVDIACGGHHSLALCSDGSLVSWGLNSKGQLGPGVTAALVPGLVDDSGVLAGKTVIQMDGGDDYTMVLCSDGTVVGWGANNLGQLGNGSRRTPPVDETLSDASSPPGGGRVVLINSGYRANLGIVASPLTEPGVRTLAASSVTSNSAVLNGMVNPVSNPATPGFEMGVDGTYGTAVGGSPDPVSGIEFHPVSGVVTGLTPGVTYHFKATATNAIGPSSGEDVVFTTLNAEQDAFLSALSTDAGPVSPLFDSFTTGYRVSVPETTTSITPTATTSAAGSSLEVNGVSASSGNPASPVPLVWGDNHIEVRVVAGDGITEMIYDLVVLREFPASFAWSFDSESSVALEVEGLDASGLTITPSLGFAPPVGADLTLVDNTSILPVAGELTNLTQGQAVDLEFDGTTYPFVVSYHGGDGNDLVLRWAINRVVAWGRNNLGQLVNGTRTNQPLAQLAGPAGFLADTTVLGGRGFAVHCADGSLRAWGPHDDPASWTFGPPSGIHAEGNGSLEGKEIAGIDTCFWQNAVLATDGTLHMRGWNIFGEIGNGVYFPGGVETLENTIVDDFEQVVSTGALNGRKVVSMAFSLRHTYALCDDGRIAAWGMNDYGQLGSDVHDEGGYYPLGIHVSRVTPVLVPTDGALAGKAVVKTAAGEYFGVALCSDGSMAAWGFNGNGRLGNGTNVKSTTPVSVDPSGVLAGRKVVDVVAGHSHCLALCSDGSLVAWGTNGSGWLGDGSTTERWVPVQVVQDGAMAGKVVTKIAASGQQSFALCSDGSLFAWGANTYGDLGDGTFANRSVPVPVSMEGLSPGARFVDIIPDRDGGATQGDIYVRSVAIVAFPPASSPLDVWKSAEVGDAYFPDWWDPDHDGLPLLVEYGLGFDPYVAESGPLGGLTNYPDGDRLAMSFTRDEGRTDVTVMVEASSTLSDDWEVVATSVSGAAFIGPGVVSEQDLGGGKWSVEVRDPFGGESPARFMRARVTR